MPPPHTLPASQEHHEAAAPSFPYLVDGVSALCVLAQQIPGQNDTGDVGSAALLTLCTQLSRHHVHQQLSAQQGFPTHAAQPQPRGQQHEPGRMERLRQCHAPKPRGFREPGQGAQPPLPALLAQGAQGHSRDTVPAPLLLLLTDRSELGPVQGSGGGKSAKQRSSTRNLPSSCSEPYTAKMVPTAEQAVSPGQHPQGGCHHRATAVPYLSPASARQWLLPA